MSSAQGFSCLFCLSAFLPLRKGAFRHSSVQAVCHLELETLCIKFWASVGTEVQRLAFQLSVLACARVLLDKSLPRGRGIEALGTAVLPVLLSHACELRRQRCRAHRQGFGGFVWSQQATEPFPFVARPACFKRAIKEHNGLVLK